MNQEVIFLRDVAAEDVRITPDSENFTHDTNTVVFAIIAIYNGVNR